MITTSVVIPQGEIQPPDSNTVARTVEFRERKYTDVSWAVLYGLSYIAFIVTGCIIWSNAHPRFTIDSNGLRTLHSYYEEDAKECCREGASGNICYHLNTDNDASNRRLQAGSSKFDGDEGMFDAFLEAPEIIVGLLSVTFVSAITWVLLLRFFSKPVVILTEVAKLAILITMGVMQEATFTKVLCFLGAVGLIAYDYWTWNQIMYAAKIMKHSTIAMRANPSIFLGSLVIKILFVGNALLFVTFFAKSFDVAEVAEEKYCYQSHNDDQYNDDDDSEEICTTSCYFKYPNYVFRISWYLSASYLWTIIFLGQMRLSIIATIVGSWHFHPHDQPGTLVAIMNTVKSCGTLSVSSLIISLAERIVRLMSGEDWWRIWLNPVCCLTAPLNMLLCFIGICFKTFILMMTRYSVILHVFTGKSFVGSAKKVFKIMSRHFKGGFATELTSKSVLYLASYVFSTAISLLAWKWVDTKFDCNVISELSGDSKIYIILMLLSLLFTLWYPVLGIYIIIVANKFLQQWETNSVSYNDDDGDSASNYNHIWIPPFVGAFVGCIAMMFFTFLTDIFLDIISTLFLCFAIDKDNFVSTNPELEDLVKQLPGYIQASDVELVTGHAVPVAPPVFEEEIMPSPSAPPMEKFI